MAAYRLQLALDRRSIIEMCVGSMWRHIVYSLRLTGGALLNCVGGPMWRRHIASVAYLKLGSLVLILAE